MSLVWLMCKEITQLSQLILNHQAHMAWTALWDMGCFCYDSVFLSHADRVSQEQHHKKTILNKAIILAQVSDFLNYNTFPTYLNMLYPGTKISPPKKEILPLFKETAGGLTKTHQNSWPISHLVYFAINKYLSSAK